MKLKNFERRKIYNAQIYVLNKALGHAFNPSCPNLER